MASQNGKSEGEDKKASEVKPEAEKVQCGIVMPISPIDGCSAAHWAEVYSILNDVIDKSGFKANMVSEADEIGIIQKTIIHNLYHNEIVVCDVSCKNPNVMFELGLRLAFDKATIIIKDDMTDYNFDTAPIEHLTYPRDLRFGGIITFKQNLQKKLEATYKKSKSDPNYSTFLKNFGEYKIAKLSSSELPPDEFILKSLEEIKKEINNIQMNNGLIDNNYLLRKRVSELKDYANLSSELIENNPLSVINKFKATAESKGSYQFTDEYIDYFSNKKNKTRDEVLNNTKLIKELKNEIRKSGLVFRLDTSETEDAINRLIF